MFLTVRIGRCWHLADRGQEFLKKSCNTQGIHLNTQSSLVAGWTIAAISPFLTLLNFCIFLKIVAHYSLCIETSFVFLLASILPIFRSSA
jgi:hypothetical protein